MALLGRVITEYSTSEKYKAPSTGNPIINGISLKFLYCKDTRYQALRCNSYIIFKFRAISLFIPLKARFVALFFLTLQTGYLHKFDNSIF